MEEKMLERFSSTDEFKEELVLLFIHHNQSVKEIVKNYNLSNTFIFNDWITVYKKNWRKPEDDYYSK
ncbi:hypothetical protein [Pedobacter sp. JCM 36344]|uniref:hypothetical protein n=1 Tax=Pedobacter sp. JCM 36344 TaxID=3374280 RepID=UPI00397C68AC